uniref:Transferrin-like domain-containing protein n=1 Tax=Timema bartmani TaxID=61472 RepID=A0A7R9I299_9NEOP|nr:unnamed protein product [Timema bartmani]
MLRELVYPKKRKRSVPVIMLKVSWYTSDRNFLKQTVTVVVAVERRFTTSVLQNLDVPRTGSGCVVGLLSRNCTRICMESGKLFWKNNLSTANRDSNLDLPIIGSLVYCKSRALNHVVIEAGQLSVRRPEMVVWCTISIEEQWKCQNFSQAIERDFALFGNDEMRLNCTKDQFQCPGRQKFYHAVAVVKKGGTMADVRSLHDLRGKRACFAEVGTLAGWVIPIFMDL